MVLLLRDFTTAWLYGQSALAARTGAVDWRYDDFSSDCSGHYAVALLGYVNERFVKLPTPIGVTLIALFFSLGLVVFGTDGTSAWAADFLGGLNFDCAVRSHPLRCG